MGGQGSGRPPSPETIARRMSANVNPVVGQPGNITLPPTIHLQGAAKKDGPFRFPEVDGSNGQVMKTDGSGTLTWQDDNDTAEVNDLSSVVTWANVPDANITESSVTQHEAAIDHDALTNFVANEHIDWTSTSSNFSTSGTAATGVLTVTGSTASYKFDGISGFSSNTPLDTGAAVLSIVGGSDATGQDAAIHLRDEQSNIDWSLFNDHSDSNKFKIGFENSIAMTILSSNGNVGIGTNSPGSYLDINVDDTKDHLIVRGRTNQIRLVATLGETKQTYLYKTGSDDKFRIYHGNDVIVIDQNANVGISTSSPNYKLSVAGVVELGNVESNTVDLSTVSSINSNYLNVGYNGYWGLRQDASHGYNLDMYNSGSELTAFHVSQNGNVGIGTTSPAELFHLSGGSLQIQNTSAPSTPSLGGALFVSGGELWYIGSSGTQTMLAGA